MWAVLGTMRALLRDVRLRGGSAAPARRARAPGGGGGTAGEARRRTSSGTSRRRRGISTRSNSRRSACWRRRRGSRQWSWMRSRRRRSRCRGEEGAPPPDTPHLLLLVRSRFPVGRGWSSPGPLSDPDCTSLPHGRRVAHGTPPLSGADPNSMARISAIRSRGDLAEAEKGQHRDEEAEGREGQADHAAAADHRHALRQRLPMDRPPMRCSSSASR